MFNTEVLLSLKKYNSSSEKFENCASYFHAQHLWHIYINLPRLVILLFVFNVVVSCFWIIVWIFRGSHNKVCFWYSCVSTKQSSLLHLHIFFYNLITVIIKCLTKNVIQTEAHTHKSNKKNWHTMHAIWPGSFVGNTNTTCVSTSKQTNFWYMRCF